MKTTTQVLIIGLAIVLATAVAAPQSSQASTVWGVSVGTGGTTLHVGTRHHISRVHYRNWYVPIRAYPSLAWPRYYGVAPLPGYYYSPGYIGIRYIHH